MCACKQKKGVLRRHLYFFPLPSSSLLYWRTNEERKKARKRDKREQRRKDTNISRGSSLSQKREEKRKQRKKQGESKKLFTWMRSKHVCHHDYSSSHREVYVHPTPMGRMHAGVNRNRKSPPKNPLHTKRKKRPSSSSA